MGSWQLEVFRMGLYVMFPVAMFHYFNQPENQESWITRKHATKYDPEREETRMLKEFIEDHKRKAELEHLKTLEKKFDKYSIKT